MKTHEHTSDSSQTASATRPPVASELRAIWSELLFVEAAAEHDNFVALGGDSIAATLCALRIRAVFGVDIPASTLLQDDIDFATLLKKIETRVAGVA